jgi:hypothetical protein
MAVAGEGGRTRRPPFGSAANASIAVLADYEAHSQLSSGSSASSRSRVGEVGNLLVQR